MTEKCGICNSDVDQREEQKCVECSSVFHLKCLKSTPGAKSIPRKNWRCDGCVRSSTREKPSSSDSEPILAAIKEFRAESNQRLDSMEATLKKLEVVEADVKKVSVEFGELKAQFEENKQKNEETSHRVDLLTAENKELKTEVAAMKRQIGDLQQQSRKNNVLITGIPVTAKEDIYTVLHDIAGMLGLKFFRHDISVAHRLTARPNDKNPPSIVVCFVSRTIKGEWLAARKYRRSLSAQELRSNFPDVQVYINEHLTEENRQLFNAARDLVKKNVLASAWINDARIIVKLTPTGRPFRLHDFQHLERLGAAPQQASAPDPPAPATPPTPIPTLPS